MRSSWSPRSLILALAVVGQGALCAASAAVPNRIAGAIAGAPRQAIPRSVHPKAALGTDLGLAAAGTRLEGMTLRFSMTDAQRSALEQLLVDQQNPASARYHQWLTPAQYAAQFGVSPADIAKVTAWLTDQGFAVTEVANSGTYVRFNGTAAQAQVAFATSIHSVAVNGQTYFANLTDAAVPAPLGSVVSAITGLHNFRLKSRVRSRVVRARPEFTSSISGSHFVAPGDFYAIYNEGPALTNGFTGAGVKIAVMGQVTINLSDVAAFRSAAGLASNTPLIQNYVAQPAATHSCSSSTSTNCPTPNQDDLAESSLDVEWAGATAPGATVIFVNSPDVIGDSLTDAVDNNLAPIMSISYGDCESSWGTSELNTLNQLFMQANVQGITIIGPSGDNGATDCDYNSVSASQGLAVDFPASSPYVTAMGGTMFNDGSATGGTAYWSATNTTFSAGTAVPAATVSAVGYIPEAVWNEDAAGATFSSGGGGVSNFFSKPAWQVGSGVPADASRDVPDIALNSAAGHEGYLYCVSGSCSGGSFRASDGVSLTEGGGTSFATPAFAGILALIEQKMGGARIGNANPTLYALAGNAAYNNTASGSVFHDITTGNNNSPCTAGTPNCPSGGSIGYSAGPGYDLATGWGSLNVYNLVSDWNLVTPLSAGSLGLSISATTVTVTPSSVAAGQNATFTATVTGAAGTPSGTVQFLVNNATVGAPVALSNGSASYTYATSCSLLGQQVVSASYSGDSVYAGSKGAGITTSGSSTTTPVQVTITAGTCADFTITPSSTAVSVNSGTPTSTITVAPVNGFTGTVVFSASSTQNSGTLPALTFNPVSVNLTGSASATTTLTLSNVTALLRAPAGVGPRGTRWYDAAGGVTLAGLLLLVLPRRRRLSGLLAIAVSAALAGGLSGCSTNNTIVTPAKNTQAGTYTVTVTGKYTSAANVVTAHSTTVVFTVN